MTQIPSISPPDGVQRIQNTSTALQVARREANEAYSQLNAFLARGIVPDDLTNE